MKKITLSTAFEKILSSPNIACQKPIYETYDKNVQGNTLYERGKVATSITACFKDFPELDENTSNISVAIATGGNPNLAKISAEKAAENAVAEADLKIACVDGESLSATDCLNFGNPEKSFQMGDLVLGIKGVKKACETLNIPIVSGNVSLYNDYAGTPIPPSAIISIFGKVSDPQKVRPIAFQKKNESIFVIGTRSKNLGGSEFLRLFEKKDSQIPKINYEQLKKIKNGLKLAFQKNIISSAHPILRGGVLKTLCESAFEKNIGVNLEIPSTEEVPHFLFSEDLGVIISTNFPDKINEIFEKEAIEIGKTTETFHLNINKNGKNIFKENLINYKNHWENQLRNIF